MRARLLAAAEAHAPRGTTFLRWVVRLTDPLFGGAQTEPLDATRWLWRYAGVTALVVALIAVRKPDVVINPQFFAEDGLAFFPQELLLGFPRAVARLYQGFPQLAHRVIAFLGGLGPVTLAPRVYAASTVLVTALGLAAFALPGFRHLVRSDGLRIAFAVAVATLPMNPVNERTLGTTANVGWFIAIWLTLSAVMRVPRSPWRAGALALAAAAAAISTPLAVINGPLWGLRVLRGIVRRDPRETVLGLLPLLTLAAVLALTPALGAHSVFKLFNRTVTISVRSFVEHTSARIAGFVVPPDLLPVLQTTSPHLVEGLAAGVAALLLLCAARDRRGRPALALAGYGVVASIGIILYGRAALNLIDPVLSLPARYRVYPLAMLCLATVAALDTVPTGRRRWLAVAAIAGLLIWVRHAEFFIPPLADLNWRAQAPQIERALRDRCPVQFSMALHPRYIPLQVVWGPRFPQPPDPAEDIVASLAGERAFAQRFVSRCEGLSEVELNLRAAAAPSGSLRVDVFTADGATAVASARLAAADVAPGWNAFCFPPVAGSLGTEYVAVLSTVGGDAGAAVHVLGTATRSPDGRAWFDGRVLTGSASLVHGCVDRDEPSLPTLERMQAR